METSIGVMTPSPPRSSPATGHRRPGSDAPSPLRIVVDGEPQPLRASPDATVAELAEALGVDASQPLWIDGRRSTAEETLADTGLVHGSTVSDRAGPRTGLGTMAVSDGAALPVLRCVAGPAVGSGMALTPGRHVVGRARDASLRVDDPLIEPYAALVDVDGSGQVTFTQLAGRVPVTVDGVHVCAPTVIGDGQPIDIGASRLEMAIHNAAVEAPGGADVPNRGFISERRDRRFHNAAVEAPGGADVPTVQVSLSEANPWHRVVHRRVRTLRSWTPSPISPPVEPSPRPAGGEAHLAWIGTLFALAGGAVIAVVMGSMLFLVFGVFAAAGAVAVSTARWMSRRRRAGRDAERHAEAVAAYDADIDAQRQRFVDHQRSLLTSVPDIIGVALGHGAALWERRNVHPDGLTVTLGWGPLPWQPVLAETSGAPPPDDSLIERPYVIADLLTPLTLNDGTTVAIVGDGAPLLRSLLVQLATTTGPADWEALVIVDRPSEWRWCDWLPHTGGDMEQRCLDADDDVALSASLDVLNTDDDRTVVVVTDCPELLVARTGALRRFLTGGRRCALVVLVPPGGAVPSVCTVVIDIGSRGRARWTPDATAAPPNRPVHLVGVTMETASLVARRMAGLLDPESPAGARDAVPPRVALSDVLEAGVSEITPAAVGRWWAANDTVQRLVTPIGIGDGVVGVDLVADGPHALIAGTTGAGKSELLRVIVSGLAARHSPARLNVVLVDYKGGATFDACALLPHTVGVVTDLDNQLAERVLTSLAAELRWREHQLRRVGAADLVEYAQRVAAGRLGEDTIPRLVVVIDEFAALAAELPEFLRSLVGIAQRGRSLGVHLILATQRPAGIVSDEIRANTNLRIALRLHDVADARDVVDDDAPARFGRGLPGRAMLRLGAQERIVFQTASTSLPRRPAPSGRVLLVEHGPGAPQGPTELDALVRSVCEVADRSTLIPGHRPWLEPLPAVLTADGFDGSGIDPGAIGLVDVPDEQRREALRWSPECGNLALFGSRGSGTTSTLITLIDALARRSPVTGLHVYVVDTVGEDRLDELRRLPNCGAVIRLGDRERLRRLVGYLGRELEARRSRSRGGGDPDIVWCVDGFGALRADDELAFGADALGDRLATVLADGPSVGMVGVLTVAPGRGAATSLAACANRWLFHLDDASEATAVGARPSKVPAAVPGRLFDIGSQRFAHVVAPRAVEARAEPACTPRPRHRRFAADAERRPSLPVTFGTLPAVIGADDLPQQSCYDAATGESQLVLGIGFKDLGAVALSVPDGEHVVVAGRARSGRSTVLRRLIDTWRQCHTSGRVIVVCPDRRSAVAALPDTGGTLAALTDEASTGRVLVVVDDAERYDDADGTVSNLIERRRSGLCVVAAFRPEALRGEYSHWTRVVRRSRIGVVMTGGGELDGDVVGEQLPRRLPIAARPGLAYAVSGGTAQLVQVARPER